LHGDLQLAGDERLPAVLEAFSRYLERACRVVDRVRNAEFAEAEQRRGTVQADPVISCDRQQVVAIKRSLYGQTSHPLALTSAVEELSKKGKGSPYSITKRRVPELIPVLQPAGDVNHKPGGRLPSLSARPAVYPRNP